MILPTTVSGSPGTLAAMDQEPASRHRERRHEGVHARFRAGQRNERRVHFGPSIVRHANAHLDDYRVGDRPFAGLVE
jgi:hypothetical protein